MNVDHFFQPILRQSSTDRPLDLPSHQTGFWVSHFSHRLLTCLFGHVHSGLDMEDKITSLLSALKSLVAAEMLIPEYLGLDPTIGQQCTLLQSQDLAFW